MAQRRYLPPLPWLVAFETVARLGSVTEAAAVLDLSQGAVSRQILKLEELLESQLFLRVKKRLILTPQGATYAEQIRDAIERITNSTINLATNPDGGTLELAILPAFGAHWLAPRLAEFVAAHPGVTLNLTTRISPFDFGKERFHAAIHFGRDDWPGTGSKKLMDEVTVPVVSPRLVGGRTIAGIEEVRDLLLLRLRTRQNAWPQWFEAQGQALTRDSGMEFDQFATMLQAVLGGVGAALMPNYLVEADLKAGRLATVANARPTILGANYLVWPEAIADYPPLVAFREWL